MTGVIVEQADRGRRRRSVGGGPADGRQRVLDAAIAQFAAYGVEGSSLQMIADAIGVTKAAVYYHFKTKDEIVLAAMSPVIEHLRTIVAAAENQRGQAARGRSFLTAFVRTVVQNRELLQLFYDDVAVSRILRTYQPDFQQFENRVTVALLGPTPDPRQAVAGVVALTGIVAAASAAGFADLDDASLEEYLLDAGLRLITRRRPTSH